jgi:hypothetical protein
LRFAGGPGVGPQLPQHAVGLGVLDVRVRAKPFHEAQRQGTGVDGQDELPLLADAARDWEAESPRQALG